MKTKTKDEGNAIGELIAKIKPALPDGWSASEGFFMSMNTLQSSPPHISVRDNNSGYSDALRAVPIDERAAFKKQWSKDRQEQAAEMERKLAGLKLGVKRIVRDGATVYVMP